MDTNVIENPTTGHQSQSQTIGALAAALARAQGMMQGAVKGSENPYFKSRYADLAAVWDACRAALAANQLCVIQTTAGTGETITVLSTLAHSSGEWICSSLTMRPVKADPQAIGSLLTYCRRYSLAALECPTPPLSRYFLG